MVQRHPYGSVAARHVTQITLSNSRGVEVRAIDYGGIITSITTPDRDGGIGDIVLGFPSLDGYLADHPYFGAIVGRYANRIANGRFTIDGVDYRLASNDGAHHLHGGVAGFDRKHWSAREVRGRNAVVFECVSADGDEGYPGTLYASVGYELTDSNELIVDYQASSDAPTHVNLAQHTYFNLAGEGSDDVLGHELTLDADAYTPVDATLIPLGVVVPVAGTRLDFRAPRVIGEGYDNNWVLNHAGEAPRRVARVVERGSGRTLEVATTEPGLQFYTGNSLDGSLIGKSGRAYGRFAGLCLETQHYPDSPNQPQFPSTLLRPGETYRSRTIFTFGTISK